MFVHANVPVSPVSSRAINNRAVLLSHRNTTLVRTLVVPDKFDAPYAAAGDGL